jgi:hypothetical protein
MVYTILAYICQHPIRSSSRLPWSGSTLDFDVHYCQDCERSNRIKSERREAEREYERSKFRHESGRMKYDEYKGHRSRYDRARLAEREDSEYQERRDDEERRRQGRKTLREEAREFAGKDDPDWLELKRMLGQDSSRRARIDETTRESHRRESQYRDQPYYRRSSRFYEPGRYADQTGEGYYDTSGYDGGRRRKSSTRPSSRSRSPPPPTRRESSSRRRESSRGHHRRRDSDEDECQDSLDTLSSDEISRRQREIVESVRVIRSLSPWLYDYDR